MMWAKLKLIKKSKKVVESFESFMIVFIFVLWSGVSLEINKFEFKDRKQIGFNNMCTV